MYQRGNTENNRGNPEINGVPGNDGADGGVRRNAPEARLALHVRG